VHDPCIIKSEGVYHVFCTGMGITHWYSDDLKHWTKGEQVFKEAPDWTQKVVSGFNNHIWAPDISFYKGKYYLFYSVSAFGRNTSAIGLTVNETLDESSSDYHWEDKGIIVQSVPGRDMWNAIDPNLVVDRSGTPWLAFGSFWDGLKLVKLTSDRMRIAKPETWFTIASRERTFGIADTLPGDAAIEAPFIFQYHGYYYLFVSYDYCCRGANSNYKIMVGRSKKVTGAYRDKNGKLMTKGGATLVLKGNKHYPVLGHNAVLSDMGTYYLVFLAYDA